MNSETQTPELPPIHIVQDRIAELKSIDLRTVDIDFLKSRLELLFRGYALSTLALSVGHNLSGSELGDEAYEHQTVVISASRCGFVIPEG